MDERIPNLSPPMLQIKEDGGFINSMDRISQLPQPILHQILSSLSQNDAVRTSVLSKSWRYLWYGRPNVEFRKDCFVGTIEEFLLVLDRTLNRYHNQNLSIQKFLFSTSKVDSDSVLFLKKWIPMLIPNKGLKKFHLSFDSWHSAYFALPLVVFKSESLQEIYLGRCRINSTRNVLFKHLKALFLKRVYIKEETFERLMSSCPLIEELSLGNIEGLRTIKVDNAYRNLKSFKVWRCEDVEMDDVSTIVRIKVRGCPNWFYRHNKHLFTHLKYLYLINLELSTESLHSLSCNFPCLEELKLDYCRGIKEFQLSSRSIKCLSLIMYFDQSIKIALDVPNLVKFEYEGDVSSLISFTPTSNKWKSKIFLHIMDRVDVSLWLHKLDELLKAVSPSETSLCIQLLRYQYDHHRFIADPDYLIEEVVNHLRSCLGSLCSDFSFLLKVQGMPTQKWNS